jgi:hypothetical protein
MSEPGIIDWNRAKLRRFKAEYERQLTRGKSKDATFAFDNHIFVMGYAKYLIEYLELRFVGK